MCIRDSYDGEAMRTLAGKKLHKKKNHLNSFLKEYEGRYEFRRLCCSDRGDVWKFLDKWRENKGDDVEDHLDYEVAGIHEILKNCSHLNAVSYTHLDVYKRQVLWRALRRRRAPTTR